MLESELNAEAHEYGGLRLNLYVCERAFAYV